MALKDEDFLLKTEKDIEKAMADLGLVLDEEPKQVEDPNDQFDFDMSAMQAILEAEGGKEDKQTK